MIPDAPRHSLVLKQNYKTSRIIAGTGLYEFKYFIMTEPFSPVWDSVVAAARVAAEKLG
jgi:hypothetical protein